MRLLLEFLVQVLLVVAVHLRLDPAVELVVGNLLLLDLLEQHALVLGDVLQDLRVELFVFA